MTKQVASRFPKEKARFLLAGPVGQLEVMTTFPAQNPKKIVGIVCHPNPTEGGTMDNKVVTTIARAFENLGCATVRFNYRGVGQSEGAYGHVTGEIDDLQSIVDWVQRVCPDDEIWLAGFSFGSFIAASVANQTEVASQLLSVAPAVNWHDFTQLSNIHCPWHVVMAEADEVVPFDQALAWAKNPPSPLEYRVMPGASHFFHGKLIELRGVIQDFYAPDNPKNLS